MSSNSFIFIRSLRLATHTVFAVQDGQKTYRDPQFGNLQAYASGQQVKRQILGAVLDTLNEPAAPITFNWQVKTDKKAKAGSETTVKFEQKEAWSPCDPTFIDQLIGGYMRAEAGQQIIKRRSPLSISAMRPLHPLLGGLERTPETITYDRSDRGAHHPVRVRNEDGQELSDQAVAELLAPSGRTLPKRLYMPDQTRATGLFVHDAVIDLRTLFCVTTEASDPELSPEIREKLLGEGWTRTVTSFGPALLAPAALRERIMPALADALLTWRITTNQARTLSLMETLAVAISDRADEVAGAIRGQLISGTERPSARPVLDPEAGAQLFPTLSAEGYIAEVRGKANALRSAETALLTRMRAFDYENQLSIPS